MACINRAVPRYWLSGLILATLATPALAQATAVSEPSDLALFALGLIGLVIGRRAAQRRD